MECEICGSAAGIVLFCEVTHRYEHVACHKKNCNGNEGAADVPVSYFFITPAGTIPSMEDMKKAAMEPYFRKGKKTTSKKASNFDDLEGPWVFTPIDAL